MVPQPFDPLRAAMPTQRHEMTLNGGGLIAGFNPIYAILSSYHAAVDALDSHPTAPYSEWVRAERERLHKKAEMELLPFGCPPLGGVFTEQQVGRQIDFNNWATEINTRPAPDDVVVEAVPFVAPPGPPSPRAVVSTAPIAPKPASKARGSLAHLSPEQKAERKREYNREKARVKYYRDRGIAEADIPPVKPLTSLAHLSDDEKAAHKREQKRLVQVRQREKNNPALKQTDAAAKKAAVLAQETAELDALTPAKMAEPVQSLRDDATPRFVMPQPAPKVPTATVGDLRSVGDLHKSAMQAFRHGGYDIQKNSAAGELKAVGLGEKPEPGWRPESRHWANGLGQWSEKKLNQFAEEAR